MIISVDSILFFVFLSCPACITVSFVLLQNDGLGEVRVAARLSNSKKTRY
jgi:hypothetical protein